MGRFIIKLLKWLILVCFVGAFLAPAALIIFNLWFLPPLFQKYAQDELSKNLGINLTYEKIAFDPRYGVTLKNFALQKKSKKGILLHTAENVKVDLDLLNLAKGTIIVEQFKISRGKVQYTEKGKSPILFSFEDFYGSLRHERLRTAGLGGWLGSLFFRDLFFIKENVLINKIECVITKREIRIEDVEMFLPGQSIRLNVLIELQNGKMNLACKLSESGFLLVTYIAGRIEAGLFSSQTKLLSATDLSRTFRKSQTFFQGVLDFNDFSEMMDLWMGSGKSKISFKSPVELEGQSIGLESGNVLCTVPLIAIRKPPDKNISRLRSLDLDQVKVDLNYYRHQFSFRTFEAKSCNGFIQAKGMVDLIFGAYEGQLSIQKVHLSCLGPILFPKGKTHRGFLSGTIKYLGGFGRNRREDPIENFEVQGGLEVRKGNLGKIRLFRKVLKAFDVVFPNLGKIRFTSGYAHFLIRTGNLFVEELKLMNSIASVVFEGKMGLRKKDLDLDVKFSVSPLGLKEKTFVSKLISGGVMMVGEQIWKAKITGTLKKPVATAEFLSIFQPVKDLLKFPLSPFQNKEDGKKSSK